MDGNRFDNLAKIVGRRTSRRGALHRLAATTLTAIGGAAILDVETTTAAEVGKEDFGCLNVGAKCNGNKTRCCSGRCQGQPAQKGRRRKNGKRSRNRPDRSHCVAHNQNICTSGQDTCINGTQVVCGRNGAGACFQTTGNAGFCGRITGPTPPNFQCMVCTKDQDCVNRGFGGGAACVVCFSDCRFANGNATACVGPAD